MANWFVTLEGTERGPLGDAQLRQLAASGELGPDALVRKDGMNQSVAAARIKGLFPPEPPLAALESAAATKPAPANGDPSAARSAFDRLQGAAQGVARAASIKKLQLHDLPQADLAIGTRAYQLNVGGESLASAFADVRRLEQESEVKRQPTVAPEQETLGDRAKRLAAEAKKRVDAELLINQCKHLLTDAGRQLREGSDGAAQAQLTDEIAAAQVVLDKIATLEAENGQAGDDASVGQRQVFPLFADWYRAHPGKWDTPLQVIAWVFWGFLWIPGWWGWSLTNAKESALRQKGKKILGAAAVGAVVIIAFATAGVESPTASLAFLDFRRQILGRTFDESSFFQQYGPPAKTITMPTNLSSPLAREMFAPDLIHVAYKCKDENAIVQYQKENGSIIIIAVIKAADLMVMPPSLWKRIEYQ